MKRKKGEKNIFGTIIKMIISIVVFVLQLVVFYMMYVGSVELKRTFSMASTILQVILVLYVLYGRQKLTYKIPWLVLIMFFPVAGIIIYLLWGQRKLGKRLKNARNTTIANSHYLLQNDAKVLTNIENKDPLTLRQIKLIKKLSDYPVYDNQGMTYYESGEKCFEDIIDDLKKAKKYILIEFFILAKGNLFDRIYNILEKKASDGVDIIIMADSWGSIFRYPRKKLKKLEELGVAVTKYNPLRFGINTYINYRDHRKIVVVDGIVGYTGGINIADEYVNEAVRFGHWKDIGIRLQGKPVEAMVIAFLKNYEIASKEVPDYEWYINNKGKHRNTSEANGNTIFFTDGPDNRTNPGENVSIALLNSAKKYVYIYTPYFVPSPELLGSITNASNSGVDVRVITPHIPDKWYVHMVTRRYYDILLKAGVKVYEYLPGFLHAKALVADNDTAIVGSINLDYRSMNLNYECAVWMNNTGTEEEIRNDFLTTAAMSKEIKLEDVANRNIFVRIVEALLNAFAPLL